MTTLYFEGELHMNLKNIELLEDVHLLKKNKIHYKLKIKHYKLIFIFSRFRWNLFWRKYYDFTSKNLIICEGHYTSRSEFRNLIDLNICLLAEKEELLERKINRVKAIDPQKQQLIILIKLIFLHFHIIYRDFIKI